MLLHRRTTPFHPTLAMFFLSLSVPSMFLMLKICGLVFLLFFLRAAWVTISCYYLTPRRIRRLMASRGVHGPKPRFLVGNLKDSSALISKATSRDMESIDHDIVGRLLPHYVLWSKIYGTPNVLSNKKSISHLFDACTTNLG